MSDSPDKPKRRINPLFDNEEDYALSRPAEPQVLPSRVQSSIHAAEKKIERVSAADKLPPPPRWPMLSGILTFPFYLKTLGATMFISFGLMVAGWLLMFWVAHGALLGLDSVMTLGLPVCLAGILTFGYTASCCLIIIEATANGWNVVDVSPGIDWKEWIWNFAHIAALVLQAGVVGYVLYLINGATSLLPLAVGTLAAFPLVLLGALAADGAGRPWQSAWCCGALSRLGGHGHCSTSRQPP